MQYDFPPKLYHYTTSNAFINMVKKNELWFTDFRFLNDSKEYRFAEETIDNTIKKYDFNLWRENFISELQPEMTFLMQFDEYVVNLKKKLSNALYRQSDIVNPLDFDNFRNVVPFVFSLSSEKDALSLWRSYGVGQICIEFDSARLQMASVGRLCEVQYNEQNEIDPKLAQALDSLIADRIMNFKRSASSRLHPETLYDGADDIKTFYRDFNPISIKHSGFKDEREWRLIQNVPVSNFNDSKIFLGEGRYPTPRMRVSFPNGLFKIADVVTGVVFGPGSDKNLASTSIRMLNHIMGTKFEVYFSSVPYRI